jgi:benzylsuccinate CoA-transferase BbsF subunit
MNSRPVLSGFRILDFSWVLAGPYATRLLADFGAEVIKVQPLLPPEEDSFSRGYYNTWNRGKRGITLDLNREGGAALAKRLVKVSDAVIENFSPRVMSNFGLDYTTLSKIKPDLIMLSLSAMGGRGPWRDFTGFGPTIQAFSGLTYLTAFPGGPPLGTGTAYADHVAGLFACLALLGALEHRRKTGEGQHIDVSAMEAMVNLMGEAVLEQGLTGKGPRPSGNISDEAVLQGVYRCRDDRWCAISVSGENEWPGFRKALGDPLWSREKRFDTSLTRRKNRAALDSLVGSWTQEHTAAEVMAALQEQNVAAGVVQDAADLARDPQLRERGFFIELEHPETDVKAADASPIHLSETPARYVRAAPLPGQDNYYVYGELLGLGEAEIARLKAQGVI